MTPEDSTVHGVRDEREAKFVVTVTKFSEGSYDVACRHCRWEVADAPNASEAVKALDDHQAECPQIRLFEDQ